jgi:hypothetical protein
MRETSMKTTQFEGGSIEAAKVVILLCGPRHDRLTEFTSNLLDGFPSDFGPPMVCKFEEPLSYDHLLDELAIGPEAGDIALVFSGHGTLDSLQGPGSVTNSPDQSLSRSRFYDDSFLHLGPRLMVAFCCHAAVGLGRSFEVKTSDRTFVGFNDLIGFVTKGRVYEEWFRKILQVSALAVLEDRDGEQLRDAVRNVYKEALAFFDRSSDKKYRYARMMRFYLRQQWDSIEFIKPY